ncbi:hypothetical protein D3H34_12510 [Acidovorax cavernicola]|uniref:Uncharacterized protein n=1 Tax=Acidovorax cavernicola TaxID=1675792 RepID=A0A9X8D5G0_9BURK|nr:hypothetical protein D3H34_12510 [Acidovorax cavernicola]
MSLRPTPCRGQHRRPGKAGSAVFAGKESPNLKKSAAGIDLPVCMQHDACHRSKKVHYLSCSRFPTEPRPTGDFA